MYRYPSRRRSSRSLLPALLVIAALVFDAAAAKAEEPITLRLATIAPEGTPWAETMAAYKKRVEAESKGRLRVRSFLGGTLGDENSTVAEARRGTIALWGGSTAALGSVVPEMQLLELPYLFHNEAEADHILDDVLFEDFKKLLEARGYVLLFWAENGYRSLGTKHGFVKSLDDVKGRKFRSQESSVHLDTYRTMGASPVPISATEVLSSLQTGVVDGFDNTPLFSFAASWYQGVKYYTVTDHIYQPGIVLMSKRVFDQLPADLQKIVVGDSRKQAVEGRVGVRALTPFLIQNFENAKVAVHHSTPAEKAAFAKATLPVHERFIKGEGKSAAAMYEKARKALEKRRAQAKK